MKLRQPSRDVAGGMALKREKSAENSCGEESIERICDEDSVIMA